MSPATATSAPAVVAVAVGAPVTAGTGTAEAAGDTVFEAVDAAPPAVVTVAAAVAEPADVVVAAEAHPPSSAATPIAVLNRWKDPTLMGTAPSSRLVGCTVDAKETAHNHRATLGKRKANPLAHRVAFGCHGEREAVTLTRYERSVVAQRHHG